MNTRERFHAIMNFETDVPTVKAEFGYWTTTIKRFIREGMPVVEELPEGLSDNGVISGAKKVDPASSIVMDNNVRNACGLEYYISKFPLNFSPLLQEKTIEENDEYRTYVNEFGITVKTRKSGTAVPLVLDFPIQNREDFEAYRELYDRDFSRRIPAEWNRLSRELKDRDFPVRLGGFPYGFLGFPRHLIGTAPLFYMMYDDPGLIKDINEFFLQFTMEYWAFIFRDFMPDCVLIWEDMASRTGSMISEKMFEEFMTPYYIRIVDFIKQFGIRHIFVDSDGYIEDLIPIWHRLGINGVFPIEVQAGNNLMRIRRNFPKLRILGGVDKRVFTADRTKQEIDEELSRVEHTLQSGGYIPHADHHVPDDSCWENFRYYRTRLNQIIDSCSGLSV
jgi:uroporphyrinogen-III decarboxylase